MELLFIDESGDDGLAEGSSEFYILAGVAVEDIFWKETFWKLFKFRQHVLQQYGLKIDELKGRDIFQHRGAVFFNTKLQPSDQQQIGEKLIDMICTDLKVELHVLAKSKQEFLDRQLTPIHHPEKLFRQEIWTEYIARYEKYLLQTSRTKRHPENGLVFYDKNQQKHVRGLIRQFTRKFDERSEIFRRRFNRRRYLLRFQNVSFYTIGGFCSFTCVTDSAGKTAKRRL